MRAQKFGLQKIENAKQETRFKNYENKDKLTLLQKNVVGPIF